MGQGGGGLLRAVGAVIAIIVNVYFPGAGIWVFAAFNVGATAVDQREARKQARNAYNASLQDRLLVLRATTVPLYIAFGRVRVGGVMVYAESTGALKDTLQMVVALLPGHEIDGIEQIFVGEYDCSARDGDGYVTAGQFFKAIGEVIYTFESFNATGSATQAVTLSIVPDTGTVTAYVLAVGIDGTTFSLPIVSVIGAVVTLDSTGFNSSDTIQVQFRHTTSITALRIREHLGSPSQTADTDLVAASDGIWTTDARGRERPYLYLQYKFDEDIFSAVGDPSQATAVIRGALLYDPRSTFTQWSRNSILQIRWYLTNILGFGVDDSEIDDDLCSASADVSDEQIIVNSNDQADPTAWQTMLTDASTFGLWTNEADFPLPLDNLSGITALNGGVFSIEGPYPLSGSYAERHLKVVNTSGSFSEYIAVAGITGFADGRVRIRFGWPNPVQGVGIIFRVNNFNGGDLFDGYRVQLDSGTVRLFMWNQASHSQIGIATGLADPGTLIAPLDTNTLECVFNGSNFEVFLNGVSLFTSSDSTYLATGDIRLLQFCNPASACPPLFDVLGIAIGDEGSVFVQPRYTGDGLLSTEANRLDNLQILETACGGRVVWSQGLFRILAGAYRTPEITLTTADLTDADDLSVMNQIPSKDLFNTVRGVHVSPMQKWQAVDYAEVSDAGMISDDGGEAIETDYALPMTTDTIMAQRLALQVLRQARAVPATQLCFNMVAYPLTSGDTVALDIPELNLDGVFLIIDRSFSLEKLVTLSMIPTDPSHFDWDASLATPVQATPTAVLPTPGVVLAPTNVAILTDDTTALVNADGTVIQRLYITWDQSTEAQVLNGGRTEVQYKKVDEVNWSNSATYHGDAIDAYASPVNDDSFYAARVRFVTSRNNASQWGYSDAEQTNTGFTGAPATPTGLARAVIGASSNRYSWSMSAVPKNLKGFILRYQSGATITWASGTDIAAPVIQPKVGSTYYLDSNVPSDGVFSFEVRSVDTSGNVSATGSQLNNQTLGKTGVGVSDLTEHAITDDTNGGTYITITDDRDYWGAAIDTITLTPAYNARAKVSLTGVIRRTDTSGLPIDRESGALIKLSTETIAATADRSWFTILSFINIPASGNKEQGVTLERFFDLTAATAYTFELYMRKDDTAGNGVSSLYGGRFRVELSTRT